MPLTYRYDALHKLWTWQPTTTKLTRYGPQTNHKSNHPTNKANVLPLGRRAAQSQSVGPFPTIRFGAAVDQWTELSGAGTLQQMSDIFRLRLGWIGDRFDIDSREIQISTPIRVHYCWTENRACWTLEWNCNPPSRYLRFRLLGQRSVVISTSSE